MAADHPELVEQLRHQLEQHRAELQQNGRPAGRYFRPLRPLDARPEWRAAGGTWLMRRYVLRQRTGAGQSLLLAPQGKPLASGVLEVDVKVDHSRHGPWLLVRANDAKNYCRWSLGGFSNRKSVVQVVEDGEMVAQSKADSRTFEKRRWYCCRIELKGEMVRCFVENELVNELRTDAFSEGVVGLGTDSSAVEFRNVRVVDSQGDVVLEIL